MVIDEADLLAPQRVQHGGERLLGAMSDLVHRGRVLTQSPVNCTLLANSTLGHVTQRDVVVGDIRREGPDATADLPLMWAVLPTESSLARGKRNRRQSRRSIASWGKSAAMST